MLEYCKAQRGNAKTIAEQIRWYRKEIAIRLGVDMGFRSCEYGNSTFNEVEAKNRVTITNSKHNGTRIVAVTAETKEVILEFKAFLKKNGCHPTSDGIFEKPDGKNYSTSTFRRWLKKTAEACEVIAKQAKTHGLRHRFARNFHEENHDEFMLANIMGHKSMATTRTYAQPTFENMQEAMQSASNKAGFNRHAQVA